MSLEQALCHHIMGVVLPGTSSLVTHRRPRRDITEINFSKVNYVILNCIHIVLLPSLLVYSQSINPGGHMARCASSRLPYGATRVGHTSLVSMQASFSYQVTPNRRNLLAAAMRSVCTPLASFMLDCPFQRQPDKQDRYDKQEYIRNQRRQRQDKDRKKYCYSFSRQHRLLVLSVYVVCLSMYICAPIMVK